jgi:hypothetical protein
MIGPPKHVMVHDERSQAGEFCDLLAGAEQRPFGLAETPLEQADD